MTLLEGSQLDIQVILTRIGEMEHEDWRKSVGIYVCPKLKKCIIIAKLIKEKCTEHHSAWFIGHLNRQERHNRQVFWYFIVYLLKELISKLAKPFMMSKQKK